MKKPKGKLETELTDAQQAELAQLLMDGMHYNVAQVHCREQYGVRCSPSSLSTFWDTVCSPLMLQRRRRLAKAAGSYIQDKSTKEEFTDAATELIAQQVFQIASSPNPDPSAVAELYKLIQSDKAQAIKQSALELQRDKFQFDAAEAALKHAATLQSIAADKKLTHREQLQQARLKLFGAA